MVLISQQFFTHSCCLCSRNTSISNWW